MLLHFSYTLLAQAGEFRPHTLLLPYWDVWGQAVVALADAREHGQLQPSPTA